MEIVPKHFFSIAALVVYNLVFYRKFYGNPFKLCTSELASTYFPFWRWSKGIKLKDDLYYYYPACIPFLSCWYPVNILTSWVSQFMSLNSSFVLFAYTILLHSLLGSVLAYFTLIKIFSPVVALFGAISLSYSAYFVKPLTPCAIYSHAWVLGALSGGIAGAFCLGMAILSGYWPTLVYIVPVVLWKLGWGYSAVGVLLGLPQIIPFLWYWPKSIRSGLKYDSSFGKVPIWRYIDLIFPNRTQNSINGVFWPEMAMYCGIIPLSLLLMIKSSGLRHVAVFWIVPLLMSFRLQIQRLPCRSLYLFSISLIMLSLPSKITPLILLAQAALLLQNADIYPHFPFCQWWLKPKEWLARAYWPSFKAYMLGIPSKGYIGGFCLKDVAARNGMTSIYGEPARA